MFRDRLHVKTIYRDGGSFLVQEGKLRLDDDITNIFRNCPAGRKISIQQLLSHTSGLPELTQNDEFMNSIDQAHTVDQIIDLAFKGEFRRAGRKLLLQYRLHNNCGPKEKLSKMDYAAFQRK